MVVLKEVNNMFWALTLEAGKRYTQKVEKAFHLSMAALEDTQKKGGDGMVSVMISTEKAEFLLCCLRHKHVHNQSLDLNFTEGEDVTFFINGEGTIHLSGYQLEEEEPYDFDSNDEMDEESETDEVPELVPAKGTKRKMMDSNIAAKLKKLKQLDEDSDDEDDDDDSDIDPRIFLDGEADSEDEDEDDDDDMEDDFIDEEDDDDDEEEEEEEEELKPQKKVQKKETVQVNTPKSGKKNKKKESSTPAQEKKQPQTPVNQVQESGDATESAKKKKKKKKNKNKDKESPEKTPQQQKQPDNKQIKSKTPNKEEKQGQSKTPTKQEKQNQSKTPKKQVLQGGVVMEEFNSGAGPSAQKGKMAHVYYVGKLQKDGKQFDSCMSGKPFKFRLGANEVISGWDKGVQGMKVGSKRRITVPPKEGYGNQKQGPIPANSTLIFDIELKSIS